NNLKDIDVKIPMSVLNVVTGVSGSGKSTLVNEIIYKALHTRLYKSKQIPGDHDSIEIADELEKIIDIDQSPVSLTQRSKLATYTVMFEYRRYFFAQTNEA